MDKYFTAEFTGGNKKISISTNTNWEAYVVGNFKLSKCFGNNNDMIDVIIPDDIYMVKGTVYFKYSDERCIYNALEIIAINECYINTTPGYVFCDGNKTVFLNYEEKNEMVELTLSPNMTYASIDNNKNNFTIFEVPENKFIVVAKEDGEFYININENCRLRVVIRKNPS